MAKRTEATAAALGMRGRSQVRDEVMTECRACGHRSDHCICASAQPETFPACRFVRDAAASWDALSDEEHARFVDQQTQRERVCRKLDALDIGYSEGLRTVRLISEPYASHRAAIHFDERGRLIGVRGLPMGLAKKIRAAAKAA